MITGILLMAHGTPSSMAEMPEYLRLVRGGRPPSDALVEEMRRNYEAIGGRSPLTDLTLAQAAALRERLGPQIPVAVGMRNWTPFIRDALHELAELGVTRVIGIPLAPQFSTLSVKKYFDAATEALPVGMHLDQVRSFHDHPLLLEAFAEKLRAACALDTRGPGDSGENEEIVFTAHALPQRVIDAGDPYAAQVAATADGVAARAGLRPPYYYAFQSAGRTPEPWTGPDISELIRERMAQGARRFLIAPIGFVCDHTEILFDIDVQARATAEAGGATLRRTDSLNTSPTFIALLQELALHARG